MVPKPDGKRPAHARYVARYRSCGLPYCAVCRGRCRRNGPYFFERTLRDGEVHETYVGRELPPGVDADEVAWP